MNQNARQNYAAACKALRVAAKFGGPDGFVDDALTNNQIRARFGDALFDAAYASVFAQYDTIARIDVLRNYRHAFASVKSQRTLDAGLGAFVSELAAIHYFSGFVSFVVRGI